MLLLSLTLTYAERVELVSTLYEIPISTFARDAKSFAIVFLLIFLLYLLVGVQYQTVESLFADVSSFIFRDKCGLISLDTLTNVFVNIMFIIIPDTGDQVLI